MKKLLIFLVCFMCLFVTGCQKKEVVTDIEDASGDFNVERGDVNTKSSENNEISNDYFFPNSSTEKIQESGLAKLSVKELDIAKNEIFARHGHDFSTKTLREYFESKKWYKAIPGKKVAVAELNQIEQSNVGLIDNIIKSLKKEIGENIKIIKEIVIDDFEKDEENEINKYPLKNKILCYSGEYETNNKLNVYFNGYDYENYWMGNYEIKINDANIDIFCHNLYFVDFDEDDDYFEIVADSASENACDTDIYRYINNEIIYIGGLSGTIGIEQYLVYDKKIIDKFKICYFQEEVLIPIYYIIEDNKIVLKRTSYEEVKDKTYTVTQSIIEEFSCEDKLKVGDKIRILSICDDSDYITSLAQGLVLRVMNESGDIFEIGYIGAWSE